MNIVEKLAGLIRDTSSSLPSDVEAAIKKAAAKAAKAAKNKPSKPSKKLN